MSTQTVRFVGHSRAERLAFVTLPGAELEDVRVRVRAGSGDAAWRCEACGRFPTPTCPHAAAVAAQIVSEGKSDG